MDYKNILIIRKNWDKIELDTYGLNWIKKKYMGTKLKSTQWHLTLILTCGIALRSDIDNATCHTKDLTHDIFINFFCKKS